MSDYDHESMIDMLLRRLPHVVADQAQMALDVPQQWQQDLYWRQRSGPGQLQSGLPTTDQRLPGP